MRTIAAKADLWVHKSRLSKINRRLLQQRSGQHTFVRQEKIKYVAWYLLQFDDKAAVGNPQSCSLSPVRTVAAAASLKRREMIMRGPTQERHLLTNRI
jgi:hypothetical protein